MLRTYLIVVRSFVVIHLVVLKAQPQDALPLAYGTSASLVCLQQQP